MFCLASIPHLHAVMLVLLLKRRGDTLKLNVICDMQFYRSSVVYILYFVVSDLFLLFKRKKMIKNNVNRKK